MFIDPVFFLHHANLDRLWWEWQQEDTKRVLSYGGKAPKTSSSANVQLTDMLNVGGLAWEVSVKDVMETNTDMLCYQY